MKKQQENCESFSSEESFTQLASPILNPLFNTQYQPNQVKPQPNVRLKHPILIREYQENGRKSASSQQSNSPLLGTTLGKFLMANRQKSSHIRQTMLQSEDDQLLMQNVQKIINSRGGNASNSQNMFFQGIKSNNSYELENQQMRIESQRQHIFRLLYSNKPNQAVNNSRDDSAINEFVDQNLFVSSQKSYQPTNRNLEALHKLLRLSKDHSQMRKSLKKVKSPTQDTKKDQTLGLQIRSISIENSQSPNL